MRNFKVLGLAIILITELGFSGCSSAMPNAVNGKYYMMGDSNCARYTVLDSNRVMCYNSDGEEMGYRSAMSNQELQQWRFNQSQSNSNTQNTLNRINYNNQQQMNRNAYLYGY
jgi:hypothetical protein